MLAKLTSYDVVLLIKQIPQAINAAKAPRTWAVQEVKTA
jgi:hypothetical protein